jgi:dihydropteroate synthase
MLYSRVEDTHFPQNRLIRLRDRLLDLRSPKVMGILNITEDSFYSGSRIASDKELIQRAEKMINDGASILDIGACSTRPGSKPVELKTEVKKLEGAIRILRHQFPNIIISVDTYRSEALRCAAHAGADLINDISGGTLDPMMIPTAGELKLPYVLMHIQGTPETMQLDTGYQNVFMEITRYFSERITLLKEAGINDIILDPGFGFGKTLEQNYELLQALDQFRMFGRPILVGLSRKSMIFKKLDSDPEHSLNGTTSLNTVALLKGASILRVHDVKEAIEIISLLS